MAPHRTTPDLGVSTTSRAELDARVDALLTLPADATESDLARARDRVVLAGLVLAESIARRYRGRGADGDDLLQVARLGLVKAARGYRVGTGSGFSAYANPTISGEIKRYFRDSEWCVRPPRALQELQQQVAECRRALAQAAGRTVTDGEVAAALGIDAARVQDVMLSGGAYRATPDDVLLERPIRDIGYDQVLDRLELAFLFKQLGRRDARLLWLRFVEGRSQSDIAAELGISQMQVSRLLGALPNRLRVLAAQENLAG